MKIVIDVTQEDINKGIKEDASKCPIARALKRTIKGIKDIEITGDTGSFMLQDQQYQFKSTKTMDRFIEKFDDEGRKAVKPFRNTVNAVAI